MPFAIAAAGISAAGAIGSKLIGGGAQSSDVSTGQAQANAALQQQRTDLAPFRTAGSSAVGVAGDLSGANGPDAATAAMANFHTDPGYNFDLTQGLRAVDAGAASKGLLNSGATIKGEETFGQGLADQGFSNYYNRLFGLSQLGESAAASGSTNAAALANVATGAAGTQAGIAGNNANAIGAGITGLANNPSVVSGINSLFNNNAVGNVDNTSSFV